MQLQGDNSNFHCNETPATQALFQIYNSFEQVFSLCHKCDNFVNCIKENIPFSAMCDINQKFANPSVINPKGV